MASKKDKEREHSHCSTIDSVKFTQNSRTPPNKFAASASSLLNSFIQPTASEASSLLQGEDQSPKGQAFRSSTIGGSLYWAEGTRLSGQSVYSVIGDDTIGDNAIGDNAIGDNAIRETSTGPKKQQTITVSSIDRDFQSFVGGISSFFSGAQKNEDITTIPLAQSHPGDIIQMLSSPLLAAEIWDPGLGYPAFQTSPPTVRPGLHTQADEFLSTGDVVEFLSREDAIYTEEVWGDMTHEAQKEVADFRGKGKGKGKIQDSTNDALAKLQMHRSPVRSKL